MWCRFLGVVSCGVLAACGGESSEDRRVGAAGAAGGGTAGSGTAGSGAAGSGAAGGEGGGAPITMVTCSDLTGYPDLSPSPYERTEVTGSNGTFVDECDADGNVVEYHCPMQQLCGGGMDCAPYPTGAAAPRTVTCEAGCELGVCVD